MRIADLVRLGARRLSNAGTEHLFLKLGIDRTRPVAIRGMVNERCNYRCSYCDFWRLHAYRNEMSLPDWQHALGGLRDWLGAFTIQFSGGEPFVWRPFLELVAWCRAQRIGWGVITNGSALTPTVIDRLVAAAPLNVDVSVDGSDAAVHDTVRGVAGSLARIGAGLARLRVARDDARARFAIRIKPTVHRANVHRLDALVSWAQEVGATSIDFSPVRPWTIEVERDLWITTPEEFSALATTIERLIAQRDAGAPIETEADRMRTWPAHFRREAIRPSLAPCRVGLRDFHILPDGDVRMCWHYPPIGSIKTTRARDLWYGERARRQRATMMRCPKFGSIDCASSCLAHRSLGDDVRRGWLLLRRGRAPSPFVPDGKTAAAAAPRPWARA
jgi:MoaA/NifB/PqqE/SkfB family radical SAM enzyme